MANKKKELFRPGPMTEGKRNIIQGLLQEYNRFMRQPPDH